MNATDPTQQLPPLGAAIDTGQAPAVAPAEQAAAPTAAEPAAAPAEQAAAAPAEQAAAPAAEPAASPAGQAPPAEPAAAPAPMTSLQKVPAALAAMAAERGPVLQALVGPLLSTLNLPEDAAQLDEILLQAAQSILSLRSDGAAAATVTVAA